VRPDAPAPSLREQALRHIRAAIVYGRLAPGEIHSAPDLARQVGMSVTPVREAMLELAGRGMVQPVRNRGFRVVERTARELDATLELRMLVEAPTIARLARALDAPALARLRALVEGGIEAAAGDDLIAFLDLDRSFHLELLEHAGNRRLVDLVDRLRDHLRFYGARPADGVPLRAVAAGHGAILDAVAVGTAAQAEAAAREHLLLTRSVWAATGGVAAGS
jgi:DNA-binding GntR family transcriptional regulator